MFAEGMVSTGARSAGHGLRRRSRAERLARKVRRAWRETRIRRTIISFVLTAVAVWVGYTASMYMANRNTPTPDEVGVVGRPQ